MVVQLTLPQAGSTHSGYTTACRLPMWSGRRTAMRLRGCCWSSCGLGGWLSLSTRCPLTARCQHCPSMLPTRLLSRATPHPQAAAVGRRAGAIGCRRRGEGAGKHSSVTCGRGVLEGHIAVRRGFGRLVQLLAPLFMDLQPVPERGHHCCAVLRLSASEALDEYLGRQDFRQLQLEGDTAQPSPHSNSVPQPQQMAAKRPAAAAAALGAADVLPGTRMPLMGAESLGVDRCAESHWITGLSCAA